MPKSGKRKTRAGSEDKPSPVLEQFFRAKEEYPDALLFFRMGDFYELFFDDAVEAAEILDITLTSRGQEWKGERIPMAGVPHHAAAGYLAKLLRSGRKVALCEQIGDPKKCKGIVPREVVRVVTPGLCLEPAALDAREFCYLVSVSGDELESGLAAYESSTGELRVCAPGDRAHLVAELVRLDPREVLLEPGEGDLRGVLEVALPHTIFTEAMADVALATQTLSEALGETSWEEHQQRLSPLLLEALYHAVSYARHNHPGGVVTVSSLNSYDASSLLWLDDAAVRNLELVKTLHGERKGALLDLLDQTKSAAGARMMRRRILSPTTDLSTINSRLDCVDALLHSAEIRSTLRKELAGIADLERLTTRVVMGLATPRDLGSLRDSLAAAERVDALLRREAGEVWGRLRPADLCPEALELLAAQLVQEPPVASTAGGVIREGVDAELDQSRSLSSNGKDFLLALETRERERTGVSTLKIKYNRVFGYFIEISKAKLQGVPEEYRRKQTMAAAERFTTDELDELQAKILSADEEAFSRETRIFEELRTDVAADASRLHALAGALAAIDVHASFAEVAHRYDYTRPQLHIGKSLELKASRHPIVERTAAAGRFVPNDVRLDADGERMMVVTGPNMSGKSTVMRQVALTVVMAQCGSFVPASRASIGLVDRVYTRVGASDNLGEGQSTFMVEMTEAASILRGATDRSLVILDEIGRGTSTYDGLALAWAIAEHLHDGIGCRAMFATHYHELCELSDTRDGVVNFNVAARERGDDVVFLHQLVEGGANRSYGIAVARLAGVTDIVLARAKLILADLEAGAPLPSGRAARLRGVDAAGEPQMELFSMKAPQPVQPSEVERTLRELDPERMTPLEALVALARLRGMLNDDLSD